MYRGGGFFVGLIIFATCSGMERRATDADEQNSSQIISATEQKKKFLTMTPSQRAQYRCEGALPKIEKKDEKRRSCEDIFSKK